VPFWENRGNDVQPHASFFYDFSTGAPQEAVTRRDAQIDPSCAAVTTESTLCIQLAAGQYRWIILPEFQTCCMMCSFADGCGALHPSWLSNATYQGPELVAGVMCDKFMIQGINKNYWFQRQNDSVPAKLFNNPDPVDVWHYESEFYKTSVPKGVFDIPSYCDPNNVCPSGP